jgi:type IV pilus assembly protein PilV
MERRVMLKTLRNDEGITLIELLVTIILLAVGMLGMSALLTGITEGNAFSSELTTGTVLAQDRLETARNTGYDGLPAGDTTLTEDYGSVTGYPLYKRETFIDADNPATGMKSITVTVFWDADGHSVALRTIISQ